MKIKPKKIAYYDWFKDIEPALCRHLKIKTKHFRDYHEFLYTKKELAAMKEKPYYDLWHVWLELWGDKLLNDSYVNVRYPHPDATEEWDYLKEVVKKGYGDWAVDLIEATRNLCIEQGWTREEKIVIWFSW